MIELTEEEYLDARENYRGYCTACHESQEMVEPDAHDYDCDSCGEPAVSGVEELLLTGQIVLV